MRGRYRVSVQNKKIIYEFELVRNITVIRGDSASGKTTLIDMLSQYEQNGDSSGISLKCEKRCVVLTAVRWKENLDSIHESIVFIDENSRFITSDDFARAVKTSDCYFVIVTRDNLYNLPYSVDEIYGIRESGKYAGLKKCYNEFYRIYSGATMADSLPECVLTEDSNSGYEFFEALSRDKGIECISAGGKSHVAAVLSAMSGRACLVIADGAAFGCEMNRITELLNAGSAIVLYLPESFEWLILKSGLVDGRRIEELLEHPEDHVESSEYFSWERFFSSVLISETEGTYLKYSKEKLNDAYLQEREKNAIIEAMDRIGDLFR
ncbi:MAG: translation initiation factor 2 [Lachnospiraceae bacterium]|nr:translation initiation factor 2 [Lachnospiraceae bacterium]